MKKDEMEIGKIYKVSAGHGTKGELKEKGLRRGYGNRWDGVRVLMLNGRFKDQDRLLTSRDVERLWTEEDEQRMINQNERREREQEMERKLEEAGFRPDYCQVRIHDQVYISFSKDAAERVYDKLIGTNNKEVKD